MNTCYLALGSNIEPRKTYLESAIKHLHAQENITVVKESFIYETDPFGYEDQDPFLNQVIEINTDLPPDVLLQVIQEIEQANGRERKLRWGPRTLDLDILLYNEENIQTETLVIPHPRMSERAFVLVPLKDIAKNQSINKDNLTVEEALNKLPKDEIKGIRLYKS